MQAVLELRTRELEAAQQRFATQQQAVVRIQTTIDECNAQVHTLLYPTDRGDLQVTVDQQRFGYIQHLKAQLDHQRKHLAHEQKRLESLRETMRVAHVAKRSLELLSEKQQKVYYAHIEDTMAKEMEDLVMARMARSAS